MSRTFFALLVSIPLLAGCFPEIDEPEPSAAFGDAKAIAELLTAGLRESAGGFRDEAAGAPSMSPAAGNLCQPDELIPPIPCADGGNIYTTINLRCNEPSGCCADDPPCEADEVTLGGQIGTVFNNCRTVTEDGHVIVMNGSITGTLTSEAVLQCSGFSTISMKLVHLGRPSITIDGRESCPGTIHLTTQAFVGSEITITVSGEVCEWPVNLIFDDGCVQTCADGHCCPAAAACGTASEGACFRPGYTVDCGNGRACPTGSTCVDNGENCQF